MIKFAAGMCYWNLDLNIGFEDVNLWHSCLKVIVINNSVVFVLCLTIFLVKIAYFVKEILFPLEN